MSRRNWILLTLVCSLGGAPAWGEPTDAVFQRFANRVAQVRVVDQASGSKSVIGSGFFAEAPGYLVTNYHVVSELVHHPEQYRAELVHDDGSAEPLRLLNLDVIHDLAVLQTETASNPVLVFTTELPAKGTRLYSIGNPHDLGSAIVEGTFNGLIEESLYEKIHFTGAINPGMSGGPTLTSRGEVVGINVSTAGNELSFLVPAKFAQRLVAATRAADFHPPASFIALVRDQLLENQAAYMDHLLATPLEPVTLGDYHLPGKIAPFFKCWGDTVRNEDKPYEIVEHQCSTQDNIFVASRQSSGQISLHHRLISSKRLNLFQFFSLYQDSFAPEYVALPSNKEYVTRFECATAFVAHNRTTLKTVFCLRAYKKLPGLYDAVLKAASLDANDVGVQTTLTVSGVSFENAQRFAHRYVEDIAWTAR